MSPDVLIPLIVMILSVIGAGLTVAPRSVVFWLFVAIAVISLVTLLPGGPW